MISQIGARVVVDTKITDRVGYCFAVDDDWIKGASRPNPSQIARNQSGSRLHDMNKMSLPFSELGYFSGQDSGYEFVNHLRTHV